MLVESKRETFLFVFLSRNRIYNIHLLPWLFYGSRKTIYLNIFNKWWRRYKGVIPGWWHREKRSITTIRDCGMRCVHEGFRLWREIWSFLHIKLGFDLRVLHNKMMSNMRQTFLTELVVLVGAWTSNRGPFKISHILFILYFKISWWNIWTYIHPLASCNFIPFSSKETGKIWCW